MKCEVCVIKWYFSYRFNIFYGRDTSTTLSNHAGVTFCISDTGTGMSPEQIKNLFRLDNQHSQKGTAGEQGTGIGLIVCKELLEKHGSALHVESEESKGSRFWFVV